MLETAISALVIIIVIGYITNKKVLKQKEIVTKRSHDWLYNFFHDNSNLISTVGVFIAVQSFIYQSDSFQSLDYPYLQIMKLLLWMLAIIILHLLTNKVLIEIFLETKKVIESKLLSQLYTVTVLVSVIWLFLSIFLKEIVNLLTRSTFEDIFFFHNL